MHNLSICIKKHACHFMTDSSELQFSKTSNLGHTNHSNNTLQSGQWPPGHICFCVKWKDWKREEEKKSSFNQVLTQPNSCTTQTDNFDNNSLCFCKGGELICPPKVGHVTRRTCLRFLRWLRKEDKSLVFDSLNMQSISFFSNSWQGVECLALVGPLIELTRGCSESACKKWVYFTV